MPRVNLGLRSLADFHLSLALLSLREREQLGHDHGPIALEGGAESLLHDAIFLKEDLVDGFGCGVVNLAELGRVGDAVPLDVDQVD